MTAVLKRSQEHAFGINVPESRKRRRNNPVEPLMSNNEARNLPLACVPSIEKLRNNDCVMVPRHMIAKWGETHNILQKENQEMRQQLQNKSLLAMEQRVMMLEQLLKDQNQIHIHRMREVYGQYLSKRAGNMNSYIS
jgi:hypothetical protein